MLACLWSVWCSAGHLWLIDENRAWHLSSFLSEGVTAMAQQLLCDEYNPPPQMIRIIRIEWRDPSVHPVHPDKGKPICFQQPSVVGEKNQIGSLIRFAYACYAWVQLNWYINKLNFGVKQKQIRPKAKKKKTLRKKATNANWKKPGNNANSSVVIISHILRNILFLPFVLAFGMWCVLFVYFVDGSSSSGKCCQRTRHRHSDCVADLP